MEFIKEQKKPTHANYKKRCVYCGREFECVRIDAKFCTALCRVKFQKEGRIKIDDTLKTEKTAQKVAKKYKSFDFIISSGSYYTSSPDWCEFTTYLKNEFGWLKSETISFRKLREKVEDWNMSKREPKFDLRKELTQEGTRILFSPVN